MKRFLSMLMALALILSLAACGNDEPVKDNNGGEIPSGNGNLLGGKTKRKKNRNLPKTLKMNREILTKAMRI